MLSPSLLIHGGSRLEHPQVHYKPPLIVAALRKEGPVHLGAIRSHLKNIHLHGV